MMTETVLPEKKVGDLATRSWFASAMLVLLKQRRPAECDTPGQHSLPTSILIYPSLTSASYLEGTPVSRA